MTILSQVDLLRRVPIFCGLTDAALQSVAEVMIKRRVLRNDLILKQGVNSEQLVIFLTGRGRVSRSDAAGREVTLALLQPGDHVGEMSLLDAGPHSATVRADCKADVLVVRRQDIAHLLPAADSLAHALMRGLVSRLRSADQDIESLALLDVRGRVVKRLKAMATTIDGEHVVRGKICRQDLAKLVGASREMVSRVMTALEAEGFLVTFEGGLKLLRGADAPAAVAA